ncbi:unnamed protein product [Lepidochelys kempii]
MSSMDPLPPALPPTQKPTRSSSHGPPPGRGPAWPPSRPGLPSPEAAPLPAPCLDAPPGRAQRPGNVRKIVGRFEHRAGGGRAPSPPLENGAWPPPGTELGRCPDAVGEPPIPEPPAACPPRCPCGCHRHRPGMVLAWVPAPEGEEPGSDGSASTDEGGPLFRRLLEVTPAPQSRWSPLKPPAPPPEDGSVVLTSYRPRPSSPGARRWPSPPGGPRGGRPRRPGPPRPCPPRPRRSPCAGHRAQGSAPGSQSGGTAAPHPLPPAKPLQSLPNPAPHPACPAPPRTPNRCQSAPPNPAPCPACPGPQVPARHVPYRRPPPSLPRPPPSSAPRRPPPRRRSTPRRQGTNPAKGDSDGHSPEPEPPRDRCCPSPKGPGWGLPLQDEPLYQTYRQAVIRKEIQRQTLPHSASPSSWDEAPAPPPGPPGAPRSTLWQDLPAVRESGLLWHISPQERKMQESLFEVLTSEASYQRSLRLLAQHFVGSRELGETLGPRERQALFSSVLRVKEISARFLAALQGRVAESLQIRDVSDVVAAHARRDFPAYVDYVRNQPYQEKEYSALMERNGPFGAALGRLQEHPLCQGLPLLSFLLLPFQRITRLKMLLEEQRGPVGAHRLREGMSDL